MFFVKSQWIGWGGRSVAKKCLKIYGKKLDKGVLNFVNLHNYYIIAEILPWRDCGYL